MSKVPEIKPEVYTAIRCYLKARVLADMAEQAVKEVKQSVLDNHEFFYSETVEGIVTKGERCDGPNHDCFLSDADFGEYQKLAYPLMAKRGYSAPPKSESGLDEWNYSIDWPFRKACYLAEDVLIDSTKYIHSMESHQATIMSEKKKLIDLIVGLVNSINPDFLLDLKAENDVSFDECQLSATKEEIEQAVKA